MNWDTWKWISHMAVQWRQRPQIPCTRTLQWDTAVGLQALDFLLSLQKSSLLHEQLKSFGKVQVNVCRLVWNNYNPRDSALAFTARRKKLPYEYFLLPSPGKLPAVCCNCITRVRVNDTIVVFDCGVMVNGDRRAASSAWEVLWLG